MVFSYLTEYQYDRYTFVFLFLAAATASLELAVATNFSKGMSFSFIVAISIVVGGIIWTIVYYTYAAVASGIGEWFGGQATTTSIVRVIAYGMFPIIVASVFTIVKIILFDMDLFKEDFKMDKYAPELTAFYFISAAIQLVLVICSMWITVIGISQVQRVSIGVAILNLLLPGLILVVVAAIIAIPFL